MRFLNDILRACSRLRKVNLILLLLCAASLPLLTFVFKIPAMQDTWTRIGYFLAGRVAGRAVLDCMRSEQSGGVATALGDLDWRICAAGCDYLYDPVLYAGNFHFTFYIVLVGSQPVLLRIALFIQANLRRIRCLRPCCIPAAT